MKKTILLISTILFYFTSSSTMFASYNEEVLNKKLEQVKFDIKDRIEEIEKELATSRFLEAVQRLDMDGIEKALKQGADVNFYYGKNKTVLHKAVHINHLPLVRLLLSYKANPNISPHFDCFPLTDALNGCNIESAVTNFNITSEESVKANLEILELLLKHKADVNGKVLEIPLHQIFNRPFSKTILKKLKLLLSYGAHVNAVDSVFGNTALHMAITFDLTDCVKELLKWKANPNIKNRKGNMPLDCALNDDTDSEIINLLLDHGAKTTCSEALYLFKKKNVTKKK